MFHRTNAVYFLVLVLVLALGLTLGCQKKGDEIPLDLDEEITDLFGGIPAGVGGRRPPSVSACSSGATRGWFG